MLLKEQQKVAPYEEMDTQVRSRIHSRGMQKIKVKENGIYVSERGLMITVTAD